MFHFIKNKLSAIYTAVTTNLTKIFNRPTIDQAALHELEKILISADTGVTVTRTILKNLEAAYSKGELQKGEDLQRALAQYLLAILEPTTIPTCDIYLIVGVNGSGKTTAVAKLAYYLKHMGQQVLVVAADTFRAAATEQLATWADRAQVHLVTGKENQDPASVVYKGCQEFKNNNYNALLIDTAGRLQTKTNLMKELEKIKSTIVRQLPNARICTLLTVDAMLGQNSFEQAQTFHESTTLDGLVLTKMDGTGKGGIVFAIRQKLQVPVLFMSYGEQIDQFKPFDPREYVAQLVNG